MAKPKKEDQEDEATLIEEMNKGLRHMLSTPPETHEEMVKRKRKAKRRKAVKK